ncbi:cytochrome c oxidase assembly protein [Bacillus sp. EB106-08-02-XG196]|jgi:putative membrane protein|uniref:cytochrome c oxidase assembly protein n=1 Tax=Bacillus sp. EB106-08-02-XG196 TaxID=2737049 RepID=UPI0015C4D124|nr:cytochrome c oxidase assembly protein [Bacillus sp. EB106-08-02-XG196]NWQ44638.1 cytochrome c oxidase assembly protein [Bacillus sp. EB106-08-02-XG196]
MENNHVHHASGSSFELLLALPFVLVVLFYILLALVSNRRHKRWPFFRYLYWILGVLSASVALMGPIANLAHENFMAHMVGHLFLGMLAPLLISLAAPMTLLLRSLSVTRARNLAQILKSWPVSIYSNPVATALLNIGGLWVLYTTELYLLMQQNVLLHAVVHLHVFLAGYLYTISIIYIDPTPHRYSYTFRTIILILSFAAHGILSKYIYAHPPAGVPIEQAEAGGMVMYYGGDIVEILLIFLFCQQWYRSKRPRTPVVLTSLLVHKK